MSDAYYREKDIRLLGRSPSAARLKTAPRCTLQWREFSISRICDKNFGFTASASGFFKAAVVCPFPASGMRYGSNSASGFGDRRYLRPRRPSKLLPVSPHDRRHQFQPNADAAALIDISAFGGNAPDDILGGQYPRRLRPPRQVCLQAMQFSVLTKIAPQWVSRVSPGLQT